jgi:uncharacterized sulfatase
MLRTLEEQASLDNTIIIVTSDNGMPFPRAKTTLYDWGVRVPMVIAWPERWAGGRVVNDLVSHTDFAPTLLDLAGVPVPPVMTGRSLEPILRSTQDRRVEPGRESVFFAIERHTWCRPDGLPYPSRAVRSHEYLYIRNYEIDRWPAGDPDFDSPHQGYFGDVDNGPTKSFMLTPASRSGFAESFALSFGKRPGEELYDLRTDPDQAHNVAADPGYSEVKRKLAEELERYLKETEDPRVSGESPWDDYPYYFGEFAPANGGR